MAGGWWLAAALWLVAGGWWLTPATFAQQPDRARTEALARRATDRLQALQREADRLASEERTLLGDLRKLEIDRQIKAEEFARVDGEVTSVQADLAEATRQMTALEQSEQAERPEVRGRFVEMYKLGQARYLRLLLSTPDLARIGQASRTVAVLAKLDRDRVANYQRTLAALKTSRAALEDREKRLVAIRAAAQKAAAALDRAAQARANLVRDIDRQRDLNAQLAGELQAAQQKLQLELRDLANGVPIADPASLPLRPFRGDLEWPVAGSVQRRFNRGSEARGLEIATADGAEARAVHGGVVAFAGAFAGYGNLVILEHSPQTYSLYGDLLEVDVKKGDRVEREQVVGTAGPTPSGTTGLYFELRIDGQPVDPLQWLRKR
ncbi:MAG: peptidoglycan DD-metalloendopeptidase family protein [Acidobacteriia bacterium]|nr:peptidoglycan DD-metalloendopeptidase family protein [Terriglobia bacterium]